jgi:hypothetical protein
LAAGALFTGLTAIGPWAYRALAPDGPVQEAAKQAAQTDSVGSFAIEREESNSRRLSSSADAADVAPELAESSLRDEIEARPLEIEFERLRREVQRLDAVFRPRVVRRNVTDGAPALFEIEQRLKVLEDELTQTAR